MDKAITTLPEGFVLDEPTLPEGFVLDEPAEIDPDIQARTDNALIYSQVTDTDPVEVFEYTKEMNQELYGSDNETSARNNNINQLGFWGKIKEQRRRGRDTYISDLVIYNAMRSGDPADIQRSIAAKDKLMQKLSLDPVEGNWFSKMLYSNAQTAGQVIETTKRGGKAGVALGLTGAGVGAVGSLLIPTVGEEPAAIGGGAWAGLKIGAKLGLAEGAALASYRQGVGEMYYDMTKNGTNPEIAQLVAQIGAIPYALIETAQLSQLVPSKKKAVLKKVEKKILPIMTDFMKRYTKTFAKEVSEEVLQKVVTDVSGDVAEIMDGEKLTFDKKYFSDKLMSALKEGAAAAEGMTLLPLPGATIETSIATYHTAKQEAQMQKPEEPPPLTQVEVPDATEGQIDTALGVYVPEKGELEAMRKPVAGEAIAAPEPPAEARTAAEGEIAAQPTEQGGKPQQALASQGKQAEAKGERDILGGEDPIQVITGALKEAKEVISEVGREKKAELRKRAAKAEGTAKWLAEKKGVEPDLALKLAKSALSGPLTDYNQRYESIRERLEFSTPGTIMEVHRSILDANNLSIFEKIRLSAAFDKFIDGHYLQKNEVELIRKFFGIAMGEIAQTRIRQIGWWEQLVEIWRAGLLTGIKTSMLNEMSNTTHAVTETASDIVAAGVDNLISEFITGKRTIAATVKGSKKGFIKGLHEFNKYMRTGVDSRNINQKYDFSERNYGSGKFAKLREGYVNLMFHLMGAEDMLFYYMTEGRSYYNQALAKGINKGLKGVELDKYADELAHNPTEDMIENAMEDAAISVFMNKTALGDVAANFQNIPVVGKVIVPFSRTPAAIAMQIINYTPVGIVKEIVTEIKNDNFDQRKFSKAMGRGITGTAVLFIGYELSQAGLMTLGYPKGERERKLWEVEGRKPFSIKIGNKWRSVYVLGPTGNVLLVGGYFEQAYKESGSPTAAMTTALAGGAKSVAEETFLRGLNQAVAAVTEPETSFNRWFSGMAGSIVPTIVADIARATDTTERRKEGPAQYIQDRFPGLRELLQPKQDIFGQDLPRYGGNPLEVMIDPTRPFKISQDFVVDELRRLWDKDIRVSPTLLGDRMGYDVLTDEENTELWKRAGQLVYKNLFMSMISPEYNTIGDEEKGKEIESIVKDAKDFSRAEMAIMKKAEGFTDMELRKGGLVTNDVQKIMDSY